MKKRTTRSNGKRGKAEPVRFAVIGQGYFSQAAVLPAFAEADGCELRAIFSEDQTKLKTLKRKYGVETALGYDQYDEYLGSGEVGAVYIALPNDLHREYAVRAARAGVHVLCEKPLAVNVADAEAIVAACAENQVRLMVAYRLHFEAATLEAIERVRRGDLGRPRFFSSTFAMQVQEGNIRTKAARGGGPLLDLGIYCVNAARSLFGAEPTEVTAMSATRRSDARFKEVDEQVSAVLRFPDDRTAQLICSFGAYDHSSLTVVGDRGRLRLDPAYDYATDLTVEVEIEGKKPSKKTFHKRDQISAELVAFAGYVRDGRDPEPSGEEGVADLRVLEAIQRATESRRTETVASVPRQKRPSKAQEIERPPHDMPDLVHAEPPGRE
ncbi:MAG TPA: Gfo/Idh/MocA family oxidoreductase [Polyangia bacterium]|nr:Gfo/Idh/MocA family oxidoreductase [Polyangia bacterium]